MTRTYDFRVDMILFFLILAQAPSFTLKALDKNDVVLDSLLENGFVVIDFWATWCKPCIRELDTWKDLNKEFKPQPDTESQFIGITFVAINEDGPRTRRNVPLMTKSRGWDFLILYDDDRKVMKLFQVIAIPHTFVIGKGREILYQVVGYKKGDEDLLRKKLKSLLKRAEESE